MIDTLKSAIHNWIPYNLKLRENKYTCEWLYTDQVEYTAPFFAETILKCKSHPYNSASRRPLSDLSMLTEWAAEIDGIKPTAFIFHISRCGSTLISQALGIKDEHIVLAETPFIDELLRLSDGDNWPQDLLLKDMLKAVFDFYGANRNGEKKHLFVKTDCWHIYFLPLLRQLYPTIPFVLLYRKPDEVIRSHQKKRGIQAVPGLVENHILGISEQTVFDLDRHMASVVESFLGSFVKTVQEDESVLLVNYNEGVEPIVKQIAAFTGIELDEGYLEQIRQRGRYNAKYPDQIFNEDVLAEDIPDYLQPAFTLYDELEKIREQRVDV
jgi:hypothetical protein